MRNQADTLAKELRLVSCGAFGMFIIDAPLTISASLVSDPLETVLLRSIAELFLVVVVFYLLFLTQRYVGLIKRIVVALNPHQPLPLEVREFILFAHCITLCGFLIFLNVIINVLSIPLGYWSPAFFFWHSQLHQLLYAASIFLAIYSSDESVKHFFRSSRISPSIAKAMVPGGKSATNMVTHSSPLTQRDGKSGHTTASK
jgi:hypothetical protein